MFEVIARRVFTLPYIFLDSSFIVLLMLLLIWKRRFLTLSVGIAMGLVYFLVDYRIFHLLLGTRHIEGAGMFETLLWMSLSYGFTNFTWIWLWMRKDEYLFEWSLLLTLWWFSCPLIASAFSQGEEQILIERTTGPYHYAMAIILFTGYLLLVIWNMKKENKEERIDIPWLLAIGILVQFSWEAGLLVGGIRSQGFSLMESIRTLVTNSLLETNLGMPYAYFIFIAVTRNVNEDFRKRKNALSFIGRVKENNREKGTGISSDRDY